MCFGLRNCCILSLEAATWCSSLCSVDLFGSGCVSSRAHHVGCGCVHCRARHFGSCCVSKRPCALCSSQQAVSLRVVLVLFCFCVLPAAESLWVSACILGGLFLEAATLSAVDFFFRLLSFIFGTVVLVAAVCNAWMALFCVCSSLKLLQSWCSVLLSKTAYERLRPSKSG